LKESTKAFKKFKINKKLLKINQKFKKNKLKTNKKNKLKTNKKNKLKTNKKNKLKINKKNK